MYELLLVLGLVVSIAALTMVLDLIATRFQRGSMTRSFAGTPGDAEIFGQPLLETYLAYRW